MKKGCLYILLALFAIVSLNGYSVRYLSETAEYIEIEIDLSETDISHNDEYTTIFLPKSVTSSDTDSPDLPQIKLFVAIPTNGNITAQVTEAQKRNITLQKPIIPIGRDIAEEQTIEYHINTEKYRSQRNIYEILPPQPFNQYDLVPLMIKPFEYRHDTLSLQYPEKLTVRINITGEFPQNMTAYSRDTRSQIKRQSTDMLADIIVNSRYGVNFKQNRSKIYFTSDFSRSQRWFRIEVNADGMYVLDNQDLSSLPLSDIDPRTIRMFSTGGAMLMPRWIDSGDVFEEIPLHIIGEADGRFDPNDKIYFYATQRDGYRKNLPIAHYYMGGLNLTNLGDYQYMNPYSKNGVYWLTWGGTFDTDPKRMNTENKQEFTTERETGRIQTQYEIPRIMRGTEGFEWFTSQINRNQSITLTTETLQDLNTTIGQTLTSLMATVSGTGSVTIRVNNQNILENRNIGNSGSRVPASTIVFQPGANQITYTASGTYIADLYLKAYIIEWHKNIIKRNEALAFMANASDQSRDIKYTLQNPNNQNLTVYQINHFADATIHTLTENTFIANGNQYTYFYVCADNDYRKVVSIAERNPRILDQNVPAHDIAIIYPAEFEAGATRLAQIYQDIYGYTPNKVLLTDVYDNFSGGHIDPIAIRNYLHYMQLHAPDPKPLGATFIGSGSIDFRNFSGFAAAKNKFPVNQIRYTDGSINTDVASDDFYAHFSTFAYPEIIVGRIPAQTPQSLNNYLDKLTQYHANNDPGWWQYRFMMLADDQHGGAGNETMHTTQVDHAAKLIQNQYLVDRIFSVEYEMDPYRRKPQVKQLIVDNINQGRLFWFYVGHGSIRNTGDEQYFHADDIPLLRNNGKFPIYLAFSCDVGKYETPNIVSLAEELVLHRTAGAIATIAATGKSTTGANKTLMDAFVVATIRDDQIVSPGEALQTAKMRNTNSNPKNDSYYNILGDPFLKVLYPQASNNITFGSRGDTLKIRQTVNVEGSFRGTNINDDAFTLVYDNGTTSSAFIGYNSLGNPINVSFSKDNLPIFNGSTEVTNSEYQFSFVVPEGTFHGTNGRILTLTIDNDTRQTYIDSRGDINISSERLPVENHDAPDIKIYLENREFLPGDTVSPSPMLIADIQDENGLKTIGTSGYNMMILLDNTTDPIIATAGFQYDKGSYQKGTLRWQLKDLAPGAHSLKVIAFDSFNKAKVEEIDFIVSENVPIAISNPLVYPSPMQNGGHFTFDITQDADIIIDIYTITGRKIQTIRDTARTGYNQIPWNGRDADGHRIANNTYFYIIKANVITGRGTSEVREKFMVLR